MEALEQDFKTIEGNYREKMMSLKTARGYIKRLLENNRVLRYSSSLDVRELKDRIEVRAVLPDTKTANANVKLTGNRIEVAFSHGQRADPKNKNTTRTQSEWGQYTQVVELPGNLKGDQMNVECKHHELLITIPKS